LAALCDIKPIHVATYLEELQVRLAAPSVKLHLAALRMLFDRLTTDRVIAVNPARAVRGPKHLPEKCKTPVLSAKEFRVLLNSIETSSLIDLRDRLLIALMLYTFARISVALKMRLRDVYSQDGRWWVRLHEKDGKSHVVPCNYNLGGYLYAYLHAYTERGELAGDGKRFLFRTARGRAGMLSDNPMSQSDAWRMIARRTRKAKIRTKIGNRSLRATGITEYLRNGGKLDIAQKIAAHESARTTGLYGQRDGQIVVDEVDRILIGEGVLPNGIPTR
jgi:integrase